MALEPAAAACSPEDEGAAGWVRGCMTCACAAERAVAGRVSCAELVVVGLMPTMSTCRTFCSQPSAMQSVATPLRAAVSFVCSFGHYETHLWQANLSAGRTNCQNTLAILSRGGHDWLLGWGHQPRQAGASSTVGTAIGAALAGNGQGPGMPHLCLKRLCLAGWPARSCAARRPEGCSVGGCGICATAHAAGLC